MLEHDLEEFDDDLGHGTDKPLALTTFLSVGQGGQAPVKYTHEHHGCVFLGI